MQEVMTRATIEEMVAHRDKAIELYRHAFGKVGEADAAMRAAREATLPFEAPVYADDRVEEIARFRKAVSLPDGATFMHVAERLTDIQFWSWIVEKGDLQSLMDKKAKDDLDTQLRYKPMKSRNGRDVIDEEEAAKSFPPVTVENVEATISHFVGQSGFIFRRGMANAFSNLDRRFRSHDGFKIGARVILSNVCSQGGGYSYGSRVGDTLQDIERVFAVLDREEGETGTGRFYRNAEAAIREAAGHKPHQFEVETAYFKIRCFMNGNGHLWMRRPDLVRKVNKLLAEYYGEVVADGQTKDDPLSRPKQALSQAVRDFDLFPTPDAVRDRMIEKACLHRNYRDNDARLRVLEPSAGRGNLAIAAINHECDVTMIEIEPERANALCILLNQRVYNADFLRVTPDHAGLFDRILMNPPFTGERDIDHVNHALKFLKPGGILVSVMSAGTEFRETKKAIAFREVVEKMPDRWNRSVFEDLPAGSFSEAGTNCNTVLLTVQKPA